MGLNNVEIVLGKLAVRYHGLLLDRLCKIMSLIGS